MIFQSWTKNVRDSEKVVGAAGFEPATPIPPGNCSGQIPYNSAKNRSRPSRFVHVRFTSILDERWTGSPPTPYAGGVRG